MLLPNANDAGVAMAQAESGPSLLHARPRRNADHCQLDKSLLGALGQMTMSVGRRMSAVGTKQTLISTLNMSAFEGKADFRER